VKKEHKQTSRLRSWLMGVSIYWLVIFPIVCSLLLLSGLLYLGDKIFQENIPESYYGFSGIVFLLVASLSGFAQVIRKEGPGPFGDISYGVWPIVSGYIIIGITWIAAIYLLIISVN
jgi:hypothetical protein